MFSTFLETKCDDSLSAVYVPSVFDHVSCPAKMRKEVMLKLILEQESFFFDRKHPPGQFQLLDLHGDLSEWYSINPSTSTQTDKAHTSGA